MRKKTTSAKASAANADIDEVQLDEFKDAIEGEIFEDPNPVTPEQVIASGAVLEPSPEKRHLQAVAYVKENLPLDASAEVQEQVARLLSLMEYLAKGVEAQSRMASAELALQRLIRAPQDTTLARRLIDDLHRKLGGRIGIWFFRLRIGTPPHVDVLMGLGLSVLLLAVLVVLTGIGPLETLEQKELVQTTFKGGQFLENLIWLGAIGAIGSAVSIFVRLNDFVTSKVTNAYFHFLTGLFKPLIGFAAANLAYVLIKSRIVPLEFDPLYSVYAFVGLAFVAGFSERLVTDLVGFVERQVDIAGERGIEAQRAAALGVAERAEIHESLSGSTKIETDSVYDDVDLDELEEQVLGVPEGTVETLGDEGRNKSD